MEKIDEFDFKLNTRPISASRPRVFKNGGVADSNSYSKFRREIPTIMESQLTKRRVNDYKKRVRSNEENIGYKVSMELTFQCANEEYWGLPMIVKPDIDNLIKAIFDQVYYELGIDDRLIFEVNGVKKYGIDNEIKSKIEVYEVPKYKKKNSKKKKSYKIDETKLNKLLTKLDEM